ncbi:MAG: methyltransferase domain-containing protein [candidate division NC10 bacterium]|nr:methyltransferase domain-containing protein [candidate division NC10 bacterium]MBI2454591.1 methyltransferase domain-containing protein [candidate division NC10 bacterium]MBI3085050.1 methyltransferase domain-containing protein [candidate division NC10 bacterium]
MALDVEVLRSEIRKVYANVASDPKRGYHFHTGPEYARDRLGYPQELLDRVPAEISASFAGVGNPFSLGPIRAGEVVLDIGSGAGMDSFIAANLVGPAGRAIGLDMTDAMLEKATAWQQRLGLRQLEFRKGLAEEVPLDDASVDVVISNGVINLTPDKAMVFREIHRVMKPGGRLQIADIIVQKEVPPAAKEDVAVWTA